MIWKPRITFHISEHKILNGGGYRLGDGWRVLRYAGGMRYPDGGGLTAEGRAQRVQVRLAAAS